MAVAEGSLSKREGWWVEDNPLRRGLWFEEGCGAEGSPLRTVELWAEDSLCWTVWWWRGGRVQLWWLFGVDMVVELALVFDTEEALVWWLLLEEGTKEEHSPWPDSQQEDLGHRSDNRSREGEKAGLVVGDILWRMGGWFEVGLVAVDSFG